MFAFPVRYALIALVVIQSWSFTQTVFDEKDGKVIAVEGNGVALLD